MSLFLIFLSIELLIISVKVFKNEGIILVILFLA